MAVTHNRYTVGTALAQVVAVSQQDNELMVTRQD